MAKPKGPGGRPRLVFDIEDVRRLGQIGVTHEEMASFFGCNVKTITDRMRNNKEFSGAYKSGYGDVTRSLRRRQIQLAMSGHATMLIWLGKQMLGQTDKHVLGEDKDAPFSGFGNYLRSAAEKAGLDITGKKIEALEGDIELEAIEGEAEEVET